MLIPTLSAIERFLKVIEYNQHKARININIYSTDIVSTETATTIAESLKDGNIHELEILGIDRVYGDPNRSDEALKTLIQVFSQINLPIINLTLCVDGINLEEAVVLANMIKVSNNLTKLSILSSKEITNNGVELLSEAIKESNTLKELNLQFGGGPYVFRQSDVTPNLGQILADILQRNHLIKIINIIGYAFMPSGVKQICSALKNNINLTHLGISHCEVGAEGAIEVASILESNKTLERIDISGNSISDIGMQALAAALNDHSSLLELEFSENAIGPVGAQALSDMLLKNNKLIHLGLSRNNFGPVGIEFIANALKENKAIATIRIDNNSSGTTGAKSIAEMLKTNTTLTQLDIGGNGLDEAGMIDIVLALKVNRSLNSLDLSPKTLLHNEHLSRNAVQVICELLQINNVLHKISFAFNIILAPEIKLFFEALQKNNSLFDLDISGNNLGHEGALLLLDVIKNNQILRKLDIRWTEIGPADLDSIIQVLESNTTIYSLEADWTPEQKEKVELILKRNFSYLYYSR